MKIISTAPTRLSLFGGGTDLNPFAEQFGGVCINMAINLRQKITLYPDIKEGHYYYPKEASENFYRTILREMPIADKTDVDAEFDGIIESGLGSSASAAVALIGAINKAGGLGMTRNEIAEKAWDIEVNKLGLYGGKQDQYAAVCGGVNAMEFGDTVKVTPFPRGFIVPLMNSLVLFYTGKNRKSATIQEGFKQLEPEQVAALNNMKQIAIKSVDYIGSGDIKAVGELLGEAWHYKKDSNEGVTNKRIDDIYKTAMKVGAIGGKIMGAGSGGHMLFVAKPEKQRDIIKALNKRGCSHVDFSICWNGLETRVIND